VLLRILARACPLDELQAEFFRHESVLIRIFNTVIVHITPTILRILNGLDVQWLQTEMEDLVRAVKNVTGFLMVLTNTFVWSKKLVEYLLGGRKGHR
jgi:hypothetical protein